MFNIALINIECINIIICIHLCFMGFAFLCLEVAYSFSEVICSSPLKWEYISIGRARMEACFTHIYSKRKTENFPFSVTLQLYFNM